MLVIGKLGHMECKLLLSGDSTQYYSRLVPIGVSMLRMIDVLSYFVDVLPLKSNAFGVRMSQLPCWHPWMNLPGAGIGIIENSVVYILFSVYPNCVSGLENSRTSKWAICCRVQVEETGPTIEGGGFWSVSWDMVWSPKLKWDKLVDKYSNVNYVKKVGV